MEDKISNVAWKIRFGGKRVKSLRDNKKMLAVFLFVPILWPPPPLPGDSVVSVSDSWPGGCEFDT